MKAGLLLPESSTHPLIPHDLLAGIKGALNYYGVENISLSYGYIGFGTSAETVKKEAEKLLLEQNIDVLVAFADHPIIEVLFPLADALNKTLLIVNNGAKYPGPPAKNVYYHTLNNCYNSFLTSRFAATQSDALIMASSFYDGGYSLCHAITTPFIGAGKKIVFNFAGAFKIEEFNTDQLVNFINENGVRTAFGVLSGNLIPEFYRQLEAGVRDTPLHFFSSPVMLEESITTYAAQFPDNFRIEGFTSWYAMADGDENTIFQENTEAETGRKPNSYSALGWDTGLILKELADAKITSEKFEIENITTIKGAKGTIKLDQTTHQFTGPAYLIAYDAQGLKLINTITAADGETTMREMLNQQLTGIVSGWLNTYMCS